MSGTPLKRLIDALQTAVLNAQAVDRLSHDLTAESRQLVDSVTRAGRIVRELRPAGGETGGA